MKDYTSLVNLMMQSGKTQKELATCANGITLDRTQDERLFYGFLNELETKFSAWYKMRWHVYAATEGFNASPNQTNKSELFRVTVDTWSQTMFGLKINELMFKLDSIQKIMIQWDGGEWWDFQICMNGFKSDGISPVEGTWFQFCMVPAESQATEAYWEPLAKSLSRELATV